MDKKIVEGRWILEAVDPVIFGACDTVLNLLEKLSYSEDNSDIYINDIKFCNKIYNRFRKQSVQADVLSFFAVTVIYSNIGIEGRCKNVLKNLDFLDTPDYVDRGKIWTNDAKYLNSYIAKVLNTSKNDGKNSFLNKKQLSVLEGWLAAFGNE
ncbi:hypothetical protein [Lactiplantibacillus plantarum]|uniref:hypothetical protein n=1 Tax=Lactiplantibacillus plantarum TaxID=1590 RepID=UPI00062D4798|nr:hypothetical protein [Lactiplantibacillus plantarum]KLD41755.1 hypothetical protein WU67_06860 [Lactiplantibacillus plantarum]KLD58513.1 hypothetical protein WP50_25620 [Lactiplantibacillus plantarum]MCG3567000.1 hypothetical protein [Lactiplantibacillus plantarum]MCG3570011.1 hypothetical protein [Lactiplantibacillus plantarum]MCK6240195.1 hypothetical protein [Lactiplantibacillus plantarum]